MELSIFIAKLFAVVYLMVGLGMLLSPSYYQKAMADMLKNPIVFYLGGIMAALAGFLIVTYHNIWESSWVVVITIFGWLGLLKGFMFLVFPGHIAFWQKMFKNKGHILIYSLVVLALGLFFGYYGFIA
ncbi:hypothetical protein JW752_02745 [Candidatus Peregrinibacteria bacterium]|nr:hypothetical protein [Candidatus Peregrinibacteria bacterium]